MAITPKKTSTRKKTAAATAAQSGDAKTRTASGPDAEALLRADHRKVEQLFQQYENTEDDAQKSRLAQQVCLELAVHTLLEEKIFYPACREKGVENETMDEAQVEHDGAKVMIAELMRGDPGDAYYDAKLTVLSEYIKHHVGEEEKPGDGIFAKARDAGVDMAALGRQIQSRKTELMARKDQLSSTPPQPLSLEPELMNENQENRSMAQYGNYRDRDDEGRFTSGNNGGGGRNGGRANERDRDEEGRFTSGGGNGGRNGNRDDYGRYASDDDHRGGGRSYRANERDRDDNGRFMSDDDRGYGGRGRNEDDRGSSRGRGHGGWFGDAEGHSQASREGWDERGGGQRSSRSRDYDDNNGGSGRGWFGDPEGHSQASREGWDERGGGQRSSRGRNDDREGGNRGSSSGSRDHGGWFGDSRGHSEAARRGWQDR